MCDPVTLTTIGVLTSVISTGLGIYGSVVGAQSAKAQANYQYQIQQNQSAFQFMEANRQMEYQFQEQLRQSESNFQTQMTMRDFEFQQQQMAYSSQEADQQRRFIYEQAVAQQNYDFQQLQTDLNRGYEQTREDQQRSIMELNAELASAAYANDLRQLDVMFMQEEEAAAQQKAKGQKEAMQARAEIRASGRTGNTVENLIADYYRQQAQYDFATNRNLAFTGMGLQEKKRGAQAQYGARLASEQSYIKTPFADPIKGLTLQPGAGVAPTKGPSPIKQQVTKGQVVQSPVYKSYVSSTPYLIEGIGAAVGGIANTVNAIGKYNAAKAAQPGRS